MDRGLRVDNYLNLRQIHPKQPPRLDHLKSLVHERGGINRNPLAHLPIWMSEGLLWSHFRETRHGCLTEWPTRSGKDQALYLVACAGAQTLVDGIVLTVNRKQRHAMTGDCGHY